MIAVETASLNAAELSEYCHQEGLYVEQVESWRDACMQANGGVAEVASRLNNKSKEKDKEHSFDLLSTEKWSKNPV